MGRINTPKRLFLLMLAAGAALLASCGTASEYQKTAARAREEGLRDDLSQMRKLVDQYAVDRGELPQSLEDLVRAGYLREIPEDPMTGRKDWRTVIGERKSGAGVQRGVVDVRSASSAKSSEGKPYSEW